MLLRSSLDSNAFECGYGHGYGGYSLSSSDSNTISGVPFGGDGDKKKHLRFEGDPQAAGEQKTTATVHTPPRRARSLLGPLAFWETDSGGSGSGGGGGGIAVPSASRR